MDHKACTIPLYKNLRQHLSCHTTIFLLVLVYKAAVHLEKKRDSAASNITIRKATMFDFTILQLPRQIVQERLRPSKLESYPQQQEDMYELCDLARAVCSPSTHVDRRSSTSSNVTTSTCTCIGASTIAIQRQKPETSRFSHLPTFSSPRSYDKVPPSISYLDLRGPAHRMYRY